MTDKFIRELLPAGPVRPAPKLKLISYSRESPYKAKESKGDDHPHHTANKWTARRRGFTIVNQINFIESAIKTDRGPRIITACRDANADGILVFSLRRLGVGQAQVALREMIEAEGLLISSGLDSEELLLRCSPDASREAELWRVAGNDLRDWRVNIDRLRTAQRAAQRQRPAMPPYWASNPAGLAAVEFIRDRDHLTMQALADLLSFHQFETATGSTVWHRNTVRRVRGYVTEARRARNSLREVG